MLLDAKIAEAEATLKNADSNSDRRRAKERKEDLVRLKRVEQIYVGFSAAPTAHRKLIAF